MNGYSNSKSASLLWVFSIVVFCNLLADTRAAAQTATWPQLFTPQCTGTGGCRGDCLNHPSTCPSNCGQNCFNCGSNCPPGCSPNCTACDPTNCACAQGTAGSWFTTNLPGGAIGIQITAAASNELYCRTVNTQSSCQISLGDGGITQISFDYSIGSTCTLPGIQNLTENTNGTEWLAFWIVTSSTTPTAEVDFIESRFGPRGGLNTNFDGNGNQVAIFPGSAPWSGSVTAKFASNTGSCPGAVQASVQTVGTNGQVTGWSCLSESTGYFFLMDTAGGSASNGSSTPCTIQVSNLAVQGTVPNSGTNCVGLPVTSN
jgi:hypothetical protein